jgi:hypothetical protein
MTNETSELPALLEARSSHLSSLNVSHLSSLNVSLVCHDCYIIDKEGRRY